MEIFKLRKHKDSGYQAPVGHMADREITVWVSANGRKKKVSELDLNHAQNIINKMDRGEFSREKVSKYYKIIETEIKYRNKEKYGE